MLATKALQTNRIYSRTRLHGGGGENCGLVTTRGSHAFVASRICCKSKGEEEEQEVLEAGDWNT